MYAIPEDTEDLQQLLGWLGQRDIPWMPVGRGYNLLVRDKGFRGAFISLERFDRVTALGGPLIKAEAGVENLTVVRFAQKAGLGGIGFISGIPGTIGGAIKMNAGAYGKGLLERTDHLTLLRGGTVSDFRIEELDYGYRHLKLADGDIVLAAVFRLDECEPRHTVGGAQVSEVHSNFLVNTGGACAADFLALAATVINAVFETSGVTLEEEVRIVGEV